MQDKDINKSKLFSGVKDFRENYYVHHKDIYKKLKKSQQPHTLFIGCSDSRVVPNLITKSLPGELFIIRNIANLVPYYKETHDTYVSTSAAIEFAVKALNVNNIIVCGHSNCGGCKALFSTKISKQLPLTQKWLELTGDVKERVMRKIETEQLKPSFKYRLTEQLNVVEQMNHLLTFPYIRERYDRGEITILGWHYVIETGEVFNYSAEKQAFERIE